MTKPPRKNTGKKLPPWMPTPPAKGDSPPRKTRTTPAATRHKGAPSATDAPGMRKAGRRESPQPAVDPHAEREALRYERPIASREAIAAALASDPLTAEQLSHLLELQAPDRFEALTRRLGAMVRDGQLLMNRRGAYAVVEKLDLLSGTVIANPEGFGFLRPDAGGGDDVFLAPSELRKAMHGDRVLVSIRSIDRRGRREGTIAEVLERRLTRVMGRFGERDGVGYVTPDDRRITHDIIVPSEARNGARNGQLVVCEITEPPARGRPPFGKVLVVLGDKLTPSQAVQAALHAHNIPHEFPQPVLDQAAAVPIDVDASAVSGRVDLRQLPLVTIDGEDARDFDDAVWCEPHRDGFRLLVAIADVSHYVRPDAALDDEAQLRATSVYFPGFVVPMLPETLSNGICSLNPAVDRMCFVCDMQVERDGQVSRSTFYEAVMRSHARLTYTQVWQALDQGDAEAMGKVGALMPQLRHLHQLYRVLAAARRERGAIEFETSEVRFVLGPSGEVVQAGMLQRNDAHRLIEECMIAANVEAARFLLTHGIPAPYRVHDRPPESKYADLQEFLSEFGLKMPTWERVKPRDFTALLNKVRKRADGALIESVLLRSQSLAVYSPENIGHFGLALEAYAHFTSPIRRYPDLLTHRAIKHVLAKGVADTFVYAAHEMAHLAVQCSEKGRRADEATREVDERYRAAWMEQHVGAEFDGVISGVTSFGLFVELGDSKVNGLVHVTQLPNDYYHFDPIRKQMTGEHSGAAYRLGDAVRVLVLRASVEDRRVDFRLVLPESTSKNRKSKRT